MIIAIDFDGTIVEHKYPEIGKELLFAFETMKELQKQNHQLILWTYRSGKELDEAVEFCRERGIEFYAVNKNYPEEKFDWDIPRKIRADVYIDDRNLGGFPGWSNVWQMLNPPEPGKKQEMRQISRKPGKKGNWFSRLFRSLLTVWFPALLLGHLVTGCAGNRERTGDRLPERNSAAAPATPLTRIIHPRQDQRFTSGEEIRIELESIYDTLEPDSVAFYLAGASPELVYAPPFECRFSTRGMKMGSLSVRTVAWYENGERDIRNLTAELVSDIHPEWIPYRIENTYPHDDLAYTQGLAFHEGYLYEGTGQYRESSLRKIIVPTGEPVRIMNLPDDVFGEGITIFKDRIYQLTYRSQVGFVYDLETFRRLQKVYYQNKEGWGLTHDGEHLIMSDGSHRIYFMDPEYFTEVRQIEVYDHKGPVSRINELEYIKDKIFANVYGEEIIVVIEPDTGKVSGQLNMKGILAEADRQRRVDVFNGIAWDPGRQRLYVTGKYWPVLFEVSLTAEF